VFTTMDYGESVGVECLGEKDVFVQTAGYALARLYNIQSRERLNLCTLAGLYGCRRAIYHDAI